jgi:F-type H+-transporting ATPase subunit a
MSMRNLPWIFLALAIVLAIVAVASQGFIEAPEHEHNPFEHVQDVRDGSWDFLESLNLHFHVGKVSKFMILEVLAAILIAAIFIPLCRRLAKGEPPRGPLQNAFESMLTFIRDEVAKPNLGEKEADRYVPFLWTVALFILFCNLLGMLPWLGSPTANLYVTGALALVAFVMMNGAAMWKMGVGHYFLSQWPHVEIVPNPWRGSGGGNGHEEQAAPAQAGPAPRPTTSQILAWVAGTAFGLGLSFMIFVIEQFGTVIKSCVLAVRLFANMFAGHTILAMILSFIIMVANAAPLLWGSITFFSVLGVVALSLLELFVAFLQTYIFVFLTALFMGMALHPEH